MFSFSSEDAFFNSIPPIAPIIELIIMIVMTIKLFTVCNPHNGYAQYYHDYAYDL